MHHNHEVDIYKDFDGYLVVCFECGKDFESVRSDSAFCSSKCRVRHHRSKDKLDKDIKKTKDMIASLISRMPSRGESKTFVALNEISADIERALYYVESD